MRRREFITLLGGAAGGATAGISFSWPLAAQAQQTAMPVIGFLDSRSAETVGNRLRGFRQGLNEEGYAEARNISIEYRWAENQTDRVPELAADLVRRHVGVIVASGGIPVILAAKAATTTIPVVFVVAQDPVKLGLVSSLARPSGNLTGINFFNTELSAKQFELLREMLPSATRIAVLIEPNSQANAEATLRDVGCRRACHRHPNPRF